MVIFVNEICRVNSQKLQVYLAYKIYKFLHVTVFIKEILLNKIITISMLNE